MNQQAGVFFINVPSQPQNEQEAVELAQKEVERLILATPTSPEREALTTVNIELTRRIVTYKQFNEKANARKALAQKLDDLVGVMAELRAQIASLTK